MGYHKITLLNFSQEMTTIVTEFWKCRYNWFHMGMCALAYISQEKLYELLGDIEGVKTYTYDILVLNR